ncbi:unnamed protein product [Chrysoparadoxa australica]
MPSGSSSSSCTAPLIAVTWMRDGEDKALTRIKAGAGTDAGIRNTFGHTPLHQASGWGWLSVVELLLQRGADPDALDFCEHTPASYCRLWWEQFPGNYTHITEEHKRNVLAALSKASSANASWVRRRLVVMLQARHEQGQDITAGLSNETTEAEAKLKELMLWVVNRPRHEMLERIIRFL